MFANLTGWHALIVLVVIVLLFGATKLPLLARSVGQSMKIFRQEIKPGMDELDSPVKLDADAPVADNAAR